MEDPLAVIASILSGARPPDILARVDSAVSDQPDNLRRGRPHRRSSCSSSSTTSDGCLPDTRSASTSRSRSLPPSDGWRVATRIRPARSLPRADPDLPFLYPPFVLPLIAPLTLLPRAVVSIAWAILLVGAAYASARRLGFGVIVAGVGPALAAVPRGPAGREHPDPAVRGLRRCSCTTATEASSIRRTGSDRRPSMGSSRPSSVRSRSRRCTPGSMSCGGGRLRR